MSKKLILIGNGFDLSHDYETSYNAFIKNLVKEAEEDKHNDLLQISKLTRDEELGINSFLTIPFLGKKKKILTPNNFLISILQDINDKKWSDIESLYFEHLNSTNDIFVLNKEFEIIKQRLEEYLTNSIVHSHKLPSYSELFDSINSSNTTIINFNYTDTLSKLYFKETSNCKVINIHGELNNTQNPIVFGYSANIEENKTLLAKNEVQFLKNIKTYNYKRTGFEKELDKILNEKKSNLEVYSLGH